VSVPRGAPLDEHEPVPSTRAATQSCFPPALKSTFPVGAPVPTTGATVAEYVMAFAVAEDGWIETDVTVPPTSKNVVPEDTLKLGSPEYVPVTVSTPTGAPSAVHEPVPVTRVTTHNAWVPVVMATDPVGIPIPSTVAEKVTSWPEDTECGSADTSVDVGVSSTKRDAEPEEPV
jgi:hypothetical protein